MPCPRQEPRLQPTVNMSGGIRAIFMGSDVKSELRRDATATTQHVRINKVEMWHAHNSHVTLYVRLLTDQVLGLLKRQLGLMRHLCALR